MIKNEETGFIEIMMKLPHIGRGVVRENTPFESALTRPIQRILKKGKPTGKLCYIYFGEHKFSPPIYIIGSICQTQRRRIIFFPGVKGRRYVPIGDQHDKVPHKTVDHLTLDPDYSLHATSKDGSHFRISPSIPRIEADLYGWFSLSISRLSCLEIVPEIFIAKFPALLSDSQRRIKDMINARDQSKFPLLHLPDDSPYLTEQEFLHIDVFIDLNPKNRKHNLLISPPTGPPVLTSPIILEPPFAVRFHKVKLPGFNGIFHFLVSKHKGQLTLDTFFKGIGSP